MTHENETFDDGGNALTRISHAHGLPPVPKPGAADVVVDGTRTPKSKPNAGVPVRPPRIDFDDQIRAAAHGLCLAGKVVDMWSVKALGKMPKEKIEQDYVYWMRGHHHGQDDQSAKARSYFKRQHTSAMAEIAVARWLGHPHWNAMQKHLHLGIMTVHESEQTLRKIRIVTTTHLGRTYGEITKHMENGVDAILFTEQNKEAIWLLGVTSPKTLHAKGRERRIDMPGRRSRWVRQIDLSEVAPAQALAEWIGAETEDVVEGAGKQAGLFGDGTTEPALKHRHQDPS